MQALIDAIRAGDAAAVAELLDRDPALAAVPIANTSPILLALYSGRPEIARLFASRGEPLSFAEACALGDRARVHDLLEVNPEALDQRSPDGFPPLGLAIFFRQPHVARELIERGADVNAAADNAQRVAPLHAAAAVQDRDTMKLLLDRGADANAKQQSDYTPLHGAASRGDLEMAALLLEHGADLHAKGTDGVTPADVARKYGKEEMAQWLDARAAQQS